MKLENEINVLKWTLPESKEKEKIIEKLECVDTITRLFNKKYGRALFHVEKIMGIPWLFFSDNQLILLTEEQANNINKVYEGD